MGELIKVPGATPDQNGRIQFTNGAHEVLVLSGVVDKISQPPLAGIVGEVASRVFKASRETRVPISRVVLGEAASNARYETTRARISGESGVGFWVDANVPHADPPNDRATKLAIRINELANGFGATLPFRDEQNLHRYVGMQVTTRGVLFPQYRTAQVESIGRDEYHPAYHPTGERMIRLFLQEAIEGPPATTVELMGDSTIDPHSHSNRDYDDYDPMHGISIGISMLSEIGRRQFAMRVAQALDVNFQGLLEDHRQGVNPHWSTGLRAAANLLITAGLLREPEILHQPLSRLIEQNDAGLDYTYQHGRLAEMLKRALEANQLASS